MGRDGFATAALLIATCLAAAAPAAARTLQVGPGQQYQQPSAAAADARDGDTVTIAPGAYFDCAIWRASRLTIAGPPAEQPSAVLTDKACAGKAAFVVEGDGVTIRRLTFTRVRVPDGNGAGIRADGRDLTVEDSRFVNNEVGILANPPGGTLRIAGCAFSANGVSLGGQRTHAVLAGGGLLRVEHSLFEQARGGDHIASTAARTELDGNRLADEGGRMTGPLVLVQGGGLLLLGNVVTLAAGAADRPGTVLATGDMAEIVVRGNTLSEAGGGVPLLRNWTGQAAVAEANVVPPGVAAVSDAGTTWHRLRARAAAARDWLWAIKAAARHALAVLVHRFW